MIGIFIEGQQSGAQLLDQALGQQGQDMGSVLTTAQQLAGTGVTMGSAAVIVAVSGIVYKLLQMATPFAATLNDIWRRHALGADHKPPQA